MMKWKPRQWLRIAAVGGAGVAVFLVWRALQPEPLAEGFASGNGRVEAVEIDIAAKAPGRIAEVLAAEGDFVTAGQILVRMDTNVLAAQRREAEAQLSQAQSSVATAESEVIQRQSEKVAAQAVVVQRQAERDVALKRLARSETLAREGATAIQELDDDRSRVDRAQAAIQAAAAQAAAAEAAIATARSKVLGARSAVEAIRATIERLQADIDDSELKAPRDGRVQYLVAHHGEVLGAGGRVLNLLDLGDVYMTFFLPTGQAGRIGIGSEVHLVLDAAPQYVIPAQVSFVADVAQFTPKTVETASERQKLMFRVKAQIAPELLRKYVRNVKTGVPGMAYVRLDAKADWPEPLRVKLPQ